MKRFYFIFFFVLSIPFSSSFGQTNSQNEAKISSRWGHIENPDSLVNALLARSWNTRNSNPDLALQLGLEAMELAREIDDKENLVKAYSFTGVAYRLMGNYMKAVEVFFEGLALSKEYNIPQQEGYAYINIANLYIYLEYYSVAIENLNQALRIAQKIDNKEMLSYVYLNMGRTLMPSQRFEEARENINKSLQLRIELDNKAGQAVCYKYLGDICFNQENYAEALSNYQKALDVVEYHSDRHLIGTIYQMMAQINLQQKKNQKAYSYAQRAMEIGQEVNSPLIIHDALKILSDIDLANKRFELASTRLIKMISLADTLTNQKLAEKVLNTEFEWERQKKQVEIDLLNKDKEIQRLQYSRQRYLLQAMVVIVFLVLLVVAILSYFLKKIRISNRILHAQKEELNNINKAKDKMFMVIGHDLRGPIWTLKALIDIIKDEEKILFANSNLTENFNALTKSVQSVSDLLENLLYWARAEDGKLSFSPRMLELNNILGQCFQSYKPWAALKKVSIESRIEPKYCVFADENMLKTIIRNLLSNAIKFSHTNGKIELSVEKENGYHKIKIRDYGIGLSAEGARNVFSADRFYTTRGTGNEMGSGMGLSLCKEFVARHGGKIWAEGVLGKGTIFYFTLPLEVTEAENTRVLVS